MKLNRRLKALVAQLAEVCWDGGSLDGGELQEMLVKAGVLTDIIVDEPCGPHCRCQAAEATAPWICFRLSPDFK